MRDSKNQLLVLLSIGLFSTWFYHFYDKTHRNNHSVEILVKDSLATQEAIRDSLQKMFNEQINQASLFFVSDLNLSAVTTKSSNREVEATSAKKANKFIFSFTLQNNVLKSSSYDLYVVIVQPGNKILQNDIWGADHFTLK